MLPVPTLEVPGSTLMTQPLSVSWTVDAASPNRLVLDWQADGPGRARAEFSVAAPLIGELTLTVLEPA